MRQRCEHVIMPLCIHQEMYKMWHLWYFFIYMLIMGGGKHYSDFSRDCGYQERQKGKLSLSL